jgi:uncharacterized membrane protein YccC
VRVTVAASVAFALYHAFDLPQGYWAVFTTVIVVQTSIGATVNLALERLIGTLFGALVGGLAVWLRPQTPLGLGIALFVAVFLTAFGAAGRSKLKVAPVTAVIMLLSPTAGHLGPLETAVLRVVEISLGSVIGVAATLLIFPARAHKAAVKRIQAVLDAFAEMIEGSIARLKGETVDLTGVTARVGAGLTGVEGSVGEAARERSARLSLGDDRDRLPQAVVRTLWRLRSDTTILARTAEAGLPEAAAARLAPAAETLLAAQAAFARTCGAAMVSGEAIDRTPLNAAHDAFQAVIAEVRRERLTRDATLEEISPYFGLVFAAESLHANLGDLADRIAEAQGRNDPSQPRHAAGAAETSAEELSG